LAVLVGFTCLGGEGGRPPDYFTVTFLDVGQGDATLIQDPGGATVLIDGGPGSDIVGQLKKRGVERIDAVILTHPHADHLKGLISVIDEFEVGRYFDAAPESSSPAYLELLKLMEKQRVPASTLRRGRTLTYGELRLEVLHPGDVMSEDDINANSVVLIASFRGLDILLPGDAEGKTLLPLDLEPVDVYKVGHHGSRDDYMEQVLAKIKPQVAVVSVGEGNSYGHPADSTLAKLQRAGVRVLRTDRQGSITLSLEAGSFLVETER
jgi:competence protein ComEC